MDRLPIFLRLTGKACLVVGGGIVAERKIRLLQRTGASITVLAHAVTPGLQALVDQGQVQHQAHQYSPLLINDFWLLVAATDDAVLNRRVAQDADAAGKLLCLNDASKKQLRGIQHG